jgi:PAS domain S-box-containing protein
MLEISSNQEDLGKCGPEGSLNDLQECMRRLKAVEAALRESDARYRAIFEHAGDYILILEKAPDREPIIIDANEAALQAHGYAREELIGKPISFLDASPSPKEIVLEVGSQLRKGGEAAFQLQHWRKDGSCFTVESSMRRWLSTGENPRYISIERDITGRKRLEARLREAQKMEAVGQLAGGVAHDFNNILAATMMRLSLLLSDHKFDKETEGALAEISNNLRRAANLTQQLLMFSRRSVLHVRTLDLNEIVGNLLKMLWRLIGENIHLEWRPGDSLPLIEADAGMIEQVAMNLAINARDAMPKGGSLTISTNAVNIPEGQANLSAEARPGSMVCLSVTDTGHGIDAATREHIFEPFFTTKGPGKGTGLGLATVHGIVGQHKGWIEVDSQPGKGTKFRVFLPGTSRIAPRKEAPDHTLDSIPGGHETILLVEDEKAVLQMASLCLRKFGYRVLEADSGREALQQWEKHGSEIDLLFTDTVLAEGMTGLELAQHLHEKKPKLRVIISSGYSADMVESGIPSGAGYLYLAKPYELSVLVETVRRCLSRN